MAELHHLATKAHCPVYFDFIIFHDIPLSAHEKRCLFSSAVYARRDLPPPEEQMLWECKQIALCRCLLAYRCSRCLPCNNVCRSTWQYGLKTASILYSFLYSASKLVFYFSCIYCDTEQGFCLFLCIFLVSVCWESGDLGGLFLFSQKLLLLLCSSELNRHQSIPGFCMRQSQCEGERDFLGCQTEIWAETHNTTLYFY